MSTQPMQTTNVATLEHVELDVDLDKAIPCEGIGKQHDHAADLLIATRCPQCNYRWSGGVCRPLWTQLRVLGDAGMLQCFDCDAVGYLRDEIAHIVEVLR